MSWMVWESTTATGNDVRGVLCAPHIVRLFSLGQGSQRRIRIKRLQCGLRLGFKTSEGTQRHCWTDAGLSV